jgi:hypothetical protein
MALVIKAMKGLITDHLAYVSATATSQWMDREAKVAKKTTGTTCAVD